MPLTRTSGKYYHEMVEFSRKRRLDNKVVFVENSTYGRHHAKQRLIKENLIPYVCSICSLEPVWNGIKLSLQLDHINGVNDDNRMENLRFVCPNCHSQQDTYAAKNRFNGKRKPKPYYKKHKKEEECIN
jgi:5-methylcytosine-specific restriction endonuclease McrA